MTLSPLQRPHGASSITFAAAALLVASSCGSSSSGQGDQNPGAAPPLPDTFSVVLSERGADGRLLPYLVDPVTLDRRFLGATLRPGEEVTANFPALSSDGRYMAVNTREGSTGRFRIIDTKNGSSRSLPLDGILEGTRGGGGTAGLATFGPNSDWVLIQSGFNQYSLARADGSELQELTYQGGSVQDPKWLPSGDQFVGRTFNPTTNYDEVTLFDVETLAAQTFDPVPGQEFYVDGISISKDGSTLAIYGELEGATNDDYEVIAFDLATGARQAWQFVYPEEELLVSDNGDYIVVQTVTSPATGEEVWLCEVATGAAQLASLPAAVPNSVGVDEVAFEPGGVRLAILSDHREDETDEITMAQFGSASFTLEPSIPSGVDVRDMRWSPAGRWLVYQRDSATGGPDVLLAYDADGAGTPQDVGDPLVSNSPTGMIFSPDGLTLITSESDATSGERLTMAYDTGVWSSPRILGPGFTGGSPTALDLSRGTSPITFSSDGRSLYWKVPQLGVTYDDRLLWLELDSPAGTNAIEVLNGSPANPSAIVNALWSR